MPLIQLDAVPALVVIDLQKGVVAMPTQPHSAADVLSRSTRLAQAFRERGLPVVLVNVAGVAPGRTDAVINLSGMPADWAELSPDLGLQPSDHRVTKHRIGAFLGTDLDAYLRGRGVTQVIISGISTSMGVESTARSAHDLGYNVVIAADAMADRSEEMHRRSVENVFPRISEVSSSEEILQKLAGHQAH